MDVDPYERKNSRSPSGSERRFGYSVLLSNLSLESHQSLATEAEALGYTDCWSGEANDYDGFSPLIASCMGSSELRMGTGVISVYTRGPALIALSAMTMARAAPGRFVLGLGTSSNVIVQNWNGIRFDRPLTRVRDTVDVVRRALQGERITGEYNSFTIERFRLPHAAPDVPIVLAALNPKMLNLAGELSDGVLLNFVPESAVVRVVDAVKTSAERSGRNGADIEIIQRLFVAVADDPVETLELSRRWIMGYAQVEVYRRAFETFGLGEVINAAARRFRGGDRVGALSEITEDVARSLVVSGTPEEIRQTIASYEKSGVDTPVLYFLTSPDSPEKMDDRILAMFRQLGPKARV